MAASSSNDGDDGVISGINVTPLVDITLVLLIIMMVTAKIIVSQSLTMNLPKAAKGQEIQLVFGIELQQDGGILVDGEKLDQKEAIIDKAKKALEKNPELRAVIRADENVQHRHVIRVLDLLKQAGVDKIAFGVTPIAAEPGAAAGTGAPAAPPAPATATP